MMPKNVFDILLRFHSYHIALRVPTQLGVNGYYTSVAMLNLSSHEFPVVITKAIVGGPAGPAMARAVLGHTKKFSDVRIV